MSTPRSTSLRCWSHIFLDAKRWLRSHGAPVQGVSVYLSNMRELVHLPTEKEYTRKLSQVAGKWSAPFHQYYLQSVHPDIESIARWAIEPLGVYDPYSGVTNNQAEGLNFVLKELQEWREAPIDCMVLALHYLQGFYTLEIARGKQNLGNYHVHPMFSNIADTQPPLLPEENMYTPEEIIKRIRGNLANTPHEVSTDDSSEPVDKPIYQLTQSERARRVIEQAKISFDPKLHTFTVLGTSRPHAVTLFPRETCSCPSTNPLLPHPRSKNERWTKRRSTSQNTQSDPT